MNKAELRHLLVQQNLRHVADEIIRLARPAIRIQTTPADESEIAIGTSKMGGLPDLPAGVDWPMWHKPMVFIGQFNLSEIHTFDLDGVLPDSGLLSFFYETDGEPLYSEELEGKPLTYEQSFQGWKVFYWEASPSSLMRQPLPEADDVIMQLRACRLTFSEAWTIPRAESSGLDYLNLMGHERGAYIGIESAVNSGGFGKHQLLGHGFWLDAIPFFRAADRMDEWLYSASTPEIRMALESEINSQWLMLLQVESSDDLNVDWAGGGLLHFSIEREALSRRDFSHVWVDINFL